MNEVVMSGRMRWLRPNDFLIVLGRDFGWAGKASENQSTLNKMAHA